MNDPMVTQAESNQTQSSAEQKLAWFIIHTYSGYEAKVMESLRQRIKMEEREEHFGDLQIPEETYEEMKVDAKSGRKERVLKKRKSFPRLPARADRRDQEGRQLRDGRRRLAPGAQHAQGDQLRGRQQEAAHTPLTEDEVRQIMNHTEETQEKPKPKYHFEKGEKVRIIDGPFANFEGDVEEIHEERSTIKVMVTVFGRSTPVELDFIQVEKR